MQFPQGPVVRLRRPVPLFLTFAGVALLRIRVLHGVLRDGQRRQSTAAFCGILDRWVGQQMAWDSWRAAEAAAEEDDVLIEECQCFLAGCSASGPAVEAAP